MARKTVITRPPHAAAVPAGGDPEDALSGLAGQERRLHARAYHHWASLLGDARFPVIGALDPEAIGDFAPHSVLLDFRGNPDDPIIAYIGSGLRDECGMTGRPERIADLPQGSLLARLTLHCDQILGRQAPAGFEAEFVNGRGHTTLYRAILLPYSSDGLMIDFVHGVVSWKEVADPLLQATLDSSLLESLAEPVTPPAEDAAALWRPDTAPRAPAAPPRQNARVAFATDAAPGTPVVLVGRVDADGGVEITGSVVGDARLADRVLRASQ
ncbi:hypothetical protein [uncultured Sphingomonas sp.]|uniref:PAS domain-containing protein n=1 Tax=uncultured Sphingomonas sp. TaxID=158754 RepID=UPI0025CBC4BC|nr:hypothetical protein [uncultured Sphingomonas sp.]